MGQSVAQCVNFLNTAIDFISNQGGILPDKAVRHYDDRSDEL